MCHGHWASHFRSLHDRLDAAFGGDPLLWQPWDILAGHPAARGLVDDDVFQRMLKRGKSHNCHDFMPAKGCYELYGRRLLVSFAMKSSSNKKVSGIHNYMALGTESRMEHRPLWELLHNSITEELNVSVRDLRDETLQLNCIRQQWIDINHSTSFSHPSFPLSIIIHWKEDAKRFF